MKVAAAARRLHIGRPGGLQLELCSRGATWLGCHVPMADGTLRSVVLPRAAPDDASADRAFLGATIGRYANRIGGARLRRGAHDRPLEPNPGSRHQLHGGPGGFHAREWEVAQAGDDGVVLTLHSPAGDQGFPGALDVRVAYRLADPLTLEMVAEARCSAPTPVALTNHAYFNLDGVDAGGAASDVREHRLHIAAGHYLPVDAELIPCAAPQPVAGTGFDFRRAKRVARDWLADAQQRHGAGYDHAFLLEPACAGAAAPAAELVSSRGDLRLTLSTTLPALQLYAGQMLGGTRRPDGGAYAACAGLCLEPGFLPDSPNHPEWPQPTCWLEPGAAYRHVIRYRFEPA